MRKNSRRRSMLLIGVSIILLLLVFINIPDTKKQFGSQHFTFIYSSSIDSDKIDELAMFLEDNYSRITYDLMTIPASNTSVNIYARRWRYVKATGNWGASGNIEGISKLHFVEQAWGEPDSKKVAVHEFTHAVVLKLLLDQENQPVDPKNFDPKFATFPTWLWEAISVYEAGQFTDPKNLVYFVHDSYPDLNELNDRSKGGKIYDVGYTVVEFILSEYGRKKFIDLIRNYGDLSKTLGLTDQEFSKAWHNFVKDKYISR